MSVEIPDVFLGEPDLRPAVSRMVHGGVREYPVEVHRVSRPAVSLSGVSVEVPPARLVGVSEHELLVRARRDGALETSAVPVGRAGRVPFVEAPYRRRVRLGIDDR